jgi:hypothetical protein
MEVPLFMNTNTFVPSEIVAIVFLAGFAIQQFLEILSPVITLFVSKLKGGKETFPGGIEDADMKKMIMGILSFLLGFLTVTITGIGLLKLIKPEWGGVGDNLVTALVIGSGTEAANTVLKFVGYVKDAQGEKAVPEIEVTIQPDTATIPQGTQFQFRAVVRNTSNQAVKWIPLHNAAGTFDLKDSGLFTASQTPGTYLVEATSKADPTKRATAIVTVI